MKYIPLSGKRGIGKFTIVDNEDYENLRKRSWSLTVKGVVIAGTRRGKNKKYKMTLFLMHRVVMKAPQNLQVDHINGNRLDNRKINLRICTNAENCRNKNINITNVSGYKGVYWHKVNKKWISAIKVNQRSHYLGSFLRKEEAVKAYNLACTNYFGEFARPNKLIS